MEFFYPGKKFPALSVTGSECMLNCPHCRGHYLRGMKDVSDPEELWRTAEELVGDGCAGFLLSGGSDEKGRVLLSGHLEMVKKIKRESDLTINIHAGLVDETRADNIVQASPDVISVDMIGSEETIKKVYGLSAKPEDFENSYRWLKRCDISVVPHVTVGLHGGRLKGEFKAIDMISDTGLIILNSLIPSHFGNRVSDEDFMDVLKYAIDNTDAKIYLGCMRERGRVKFEKTAIELGASGIVLPSRKTALWAGRDHKVKVLETCCATYL